MFVSCTSTGVATENTEGSREIASMSEAQLEQLEQQLIQLEQQFIQKCPAYSQLEGEMFDGDSVDSSAVDKVGGYFTYKG